MSAVAVPAAQKLLTVSVGDVVYCIDVAHVTEIIRLQTITQIPGVPMHIRGVINLRGIVIPVIDVRTRFGIETRDYDERTCIVVVKVRGTMVGCTVDAVLEVTDIPLDAIQPPPGAGTELIPSYVKAMAKVKDVVYVLLDTEALLSDTVANVAAPAEYASY